MDQPPYKTFDNGAPMWNLGRKIETLSNLAIIVVAILLSSILVRNYLWPKPVGSVGDAGKVNIRPSPPNEINKMVGREISLPDVDWKQTMQTVVLAIESKCHFCSESAPFYKELATRRTLQLVAVSPEPPDIARGYLDSLGVGVNSVKQVDFRSIGIPGTPVLLLVDTAGVVTNAWIGRLDSTRQAEVLGLLR